MIIIHIHHLQWIQGKGDSQCVSRMQSNLHKCIIRNCISIIRHAFWKYLFCANDILNIGVMTHADTQPVLVALDLHFLFRYKVHLVTDWHPTPRIALFVRPFVRYRKISHHRYMHHTYTHASGSRIEDHRYVHHTHIDQSQGSRIIDMCIIHTCSIVKDQGT